jgi:hypothetical protein
MSNKTLLSRKEQIRRTLSADFLKASISYDPEGKWKNNPMIGLGYLGSAEDPHNKLYVSEYGRDLDDPKYESMIPLGLGYIEKNTKLFLAGDLVLYSNFNCPTHTTIVSSFSSKGYRIKCLCYYCHVLRFEHPDELDGKRLDDPAVLQFIEELYAQSGRLPGRCM